MKSSKQCIQISMKTCSLCNKSTEDEGISLTYFGEWMSKKEITIHYYCLLLSTHLPQRGGDNSGILGFLLRDIRIEIKNAKNRKCRYCSEAGATIKCFTCQAYFHLTCGHTSKCLSQFVGDFKSFCHDCIPSDPYKRELFARKPPKTTELCFICAQIMGTNTQGWIYAKCCGNGFTHSKCMKIYALSAGYYLTCIWCKDKQFREDIKYQGIFVPDRDANWEKEKNAYGELYSRHQRCDMEVCNCPKGRYYSNALKWQLIICKLCGAFGAHNPSCIPGYETAKVKVQEFKCDICSVTEQTVLSQTILYTKQDFINTSLYVGKSKTGETERDLSISQSGCTSSQKSQLNYVCKPASIATNTLLSNGTPQNIQIQTAAYTLTQSPTNSQQIPASESYSQRNYHAESSDSDDSIIANLLVQKVLNIFEVNSTQSENKGNGRQNVSEFDLSQEMPANGQQAPTDMITKTNNETTKELDGNGVFSCVKPLTETNIISVSESYLHDVGNKDISDSDDSIIADLLAQKVLDVFEAT